MSKPALNTSFLKNLSNTHRLFALVWEASPQWLLAMVLITVMGSLLPIGLLYTNKLIIDWITSNAGALKSSHHNAWMPIIIFISARLGLSVARLALGEARPFVSQLLGDKLSLSATQKLLYQAIRLDLNHFESPAFYDALNRATQSGTSYPVRSLDYATSLAGQMINLAGLIVLLMQFSPIILALLMLATLPLLHKGVSFSKKQFMLNRKNTFEGRLAAYFQGLLTQQRYAKEIRLFNLGEQIVSQWQQTYKQYKQEVEQMARKQAIGRFCIGVVPNICFYAAYGWIVVRTVQGQITLGDFVMYSGAFGQAQSLSTGCVQNLAKTYDANLHTSQFFEFLALQPRIISPAAPKAFPAAIKQGIALRQVGFAYPTNQQSTKDKQPQHAVFKNVSFEVHPGESIAVVGINGAGKTTLVKLLTRLYEPTTGEITIDGIPLSEFDLKELRQNIAVLFQDFAQYKLSIQENIGFGDIENWHDGNKAQKAAQKAGISAFIERLDQQYDTKLGNLFPHGRELSGGQWQKIGLSRAFMSNAQILILDEPTSAMDAIAEFDLYQRFRELTRDKITFFISHRFSSVRLADRILVLDQGQIAELGTHEELLDQAGLYAKMFGLQASGYAA
ncbi:MAG: ABC transporter ATP-binding protein [Cyanobacteria bacterium J06581_3]